MDLIFPDLNTVPRLRRDDVNVLAIINEVFIFDPVTEHQIFFQTSPGKRYQFQESVDLVSWTTLPTFYEGDGTLKSAVFPNTGIKRNFRMLEHLNESTEPANLLAYAAIDGTYVLLEWTKVTSVPLSPTAHWQITRDGQNRATALIPATSYKDTPVTPGPHTYGVGFYN